MTADSNFEIRRLGAELLYNLGDNAIGCLTSFTWTIIEALAAEKIPDIRGIHNQAIIGKLYTLQVPRYWVYRCEILVFSLLI